MSPARANNTNACQPAGAKRSKAVPAPVSLPAPEIAARVPQQNDPNVRDSSPAGSQDTTFAGYDEQIKQARRKSKKTEQSVKKFREEIKEDEGRVMAKIEEERKRIATEQKSFEGEVFKLIQDALALPEPKKSGIDRPVSKHVSYTDVKLHPVYKEAKVYRRAANTVLHQIDKLINLESSESMGASDAGGKITASIQSAKRAIIGGRTMTKKDVDKLMADKFNEVSNGSQMTDQEKEEAKGLLAMGQEKTVEGVESGNPKANTIGWDERAQMMQSAIADMEWAAGDAT